MIPACSHTGTPRHFHSSTTSAQASLMRARTRASVPPRQSPSSLILPSINREGDALSFAFVAALLVFFMLCPLLGLPTDTCYLGFLTCCIEVYTRLAASAKSDS